MLEDLFPLPPQNERGKVKWFNEEKGYGFIVPEDGGDDIFFHFSSIQQKGFKTMVGGQLVEFQASDTGEGKKATYVRIALL